MRADATPIGADATREDLDAISRSIIGAAQKVANTPGRGFLEKVYENSLVVELESRGLRVAQQARHRQQCINCLKATGHRVCPLINFGHARLEVRRLVWRF